MNWNLLCGGGGRGRGEGEGEGGMGHWVIEKSFPKQLIVHRMKGILKVLPNLPSIQLYTKNTKSAHILCKGLAIRPT